MECLWLVWRSEAHAYKIATSTATRDCAGAWNQAALRRARLSSVELYAIRLIAYEPDNQNTQVDYPSLFIASGITRWPIYPSR
jgi:hypothetical protein